ncbi:LOW QUALITY PROTEIN: protein phosphatase 1 regulatory subunit 14A [Manacus candei]|uniref:LOW QUALITY PROTEIN: protein phosphatase 1 regulatory subunit 14A n=1 Tax=Manacus candei TaxID=415023 RepID=UPI002226CAC3|nr:LOW QUALITY PROTEIN: protein phosphatase 1 regulatory subunit 14A [Manacus candei]
MAAERGGAAAGPGGGVPPRGRPGGLSPARGSPARSPGVQRRPARATVKYNRRELQRRLDTELWIDGRLGELYRGREGEMPDELNIDELLELETDQERAQKLQGILSSCAADTQGFIQELLEQLKGLPKQQLLQRPPPQQEGPAAPP